MTTQIVPGTGQGALFTQQGPGTTPGYSALDDRRSNSGSLQAGVFGTSTLVTAGGVANTGQADFMVTQRGAGANMSVDINMPGGGFAFVQGTTLSGQGLYCVPVHSANINETIAAADPTNPRIDSVILEIQDNVLDASGGNQARTRVLTGAPQAGTTLNSRAGAVALPANAILLADVLVAAAVGSIANTAVRDRRRWARGAYDRIIRTGADYTTTSTSLVDIDATNLKPRVECSGLSLCVRLLANCSVSATPFQGVFDLAVDGTLQNDRRYVNPQAAGAAATAEVDLSWEAVPAAGSHLISVFWSNNQAGTMTLYANTATNRTLTLVVEELIRQNAANNTVTTG